MAISDLSYFFVKNKPHSIYNIMENKLDAKMGKVLDEFHKCIFKILKCVDDKLSNNIEVDRLKRLVRIARDESPFEIIDRCKNKIWDSREHIINKNEEYFLKNSFDKYIKKDENQMFIQSLVQLFRDNHDQLTAQEKNYIWGLNLKMLNCVTEYKILTGDYVA